MTESFVTLLDNSRWAHYDDVLSNILLHILQSLFYWLIATNLRSEDVHEHLQFARTLCVGVNPNYLVKKIHFIMSLYVLTFCKKN